MVVCVEYLGPVRFSHWDGDKPVGAPIQYPFIRCLATEEGQSGNTYDNVVLMLRHLKDTWPAEFGDLDVGLTRITKKQNGGGEILPSTGSSASKDGGKETFCVGDEDHLYVTPILRGMFATVARNLTKRKKAEPWFMTTTTQFQPGQDSMAERHRDDAEAQLSGKRKRRLSFMFDHREGHVIPEDKRQHLPTILASLREAYGVFSEVMDLRRIAEDEALAPDVDWQQFERYFLNLRSSGTGSAVDLAVWDQLADKRPVPHGADVVLCFDGSKSRDATALLVWEVGDVPHLDAVGIWERPANAPSGRDGWEMPRDEVDGAVAIAFKRWNVRAMVCDPPYWRDYIDRWALEYGEDIVISFDTQSGARMGPAVSRFIDEAVPDGSFTHSGDLVLRRHVGNMLRTQTRGGYPAVGRASRGDSLFIDAGVAAIIGYHAAADLDPPPPAPHGAVVIRL
jgi:phage terminase large subunit-like protein